MQTLVTRSISALVYAVLFITAIYFSLASYIALISIFSAICLWEYSKMVQFKNSLLFLLLPAVIISTILFANQTVLLVLLVITILCSIRLLYHLYAKETKYPKLFIEKLDIGIRYIILPFIFLLLVPIINGKYEPWLIIYILILIWTNDSFAYLTGKKFGKKKLFERISPKKTINGFIGGMIFSMVAGFIIGYNTILFTLTDWIIISIIVSVFGTYGDLVESKFKRQAGVKDSGSIMPGHGGLLDRLDSLIFLAPFVYLYLHFLI